METTQLINVINLEKRKDRMDQFIKQSHEQPFMYRRWEGIVIPQIPFLGISKSHRRIVEDAKNRGYKSVTIAEDDCVFTSQDSWKYYCENEPTSYDIYHGGIYQTEIENNRVKFGFSSLTLYTVHERFYDDFLGMKEMNHLDRELGRFAWKYEYMVVPELVCFQSNGYSDNKLEDANYDHLLEGFKVFGR